MSDWLNRYLDYTKEMESPRIFHLWSGIAVLGHILGRKCWVNRGGKYKIFPGQIMVILVARSAIARKSTAIRMITPFLNVVPKWTAHKLPKKLSPQQLIQCMESIGSIPMGETSRPKFDPFDRRRDCCGLIVAEELGMFFTAEEFARALPTHICDFNDAPPGLNSFEFRKWKAEVWNPCVGQLGATTPKGMAKELPNEARQAGYLGRNILVYGEPTGKANSLTEEAEKEDDTLKLELEQDFIEIAKMRGEFRWSDSGKRTFDDWYYNYHDWVKTHIDAGIESDDTGYFGRKGDHVIRVATVLSASESGDMTLCSRHVKRTLSELGAVEKVIPNALAEMGAQRHAEVESKILNVLDRADDWIPRWKLAKEMRRFGDKRIRDASLESLLETKEIESDNVGGTVFVRKARSKEKKAKGD
jgi:hypothetical protein